jgi:hypothetical protein
MLARGQNFHQEQLVPRLTSVIEALQKPATAVVAVPAVHRIPPGSSNDNIPESLAAAAGQERNWSQGD